MLQIVDFLSSVPLFRGLSRDALYRLAEVTREKIYARNGVICFEGDPGDALFIVRTGRVKVVLVGDDGRALGGRGHRRAGRGPVLRRTLAH